MTYSFEKSKSEKDKLYKKMWNGTEFCAKSFITQTNWTGKKSNDSFFIKSPITSFLMSKLDSAIARDLATAFEINDERKRELFVQKTKQACGGSGVEALKITTMHSSSLCSLLFFYDVSDENKLELELGNGPSKKSYLFTKSYLEFQNKVIKRGAPSNMDVVLVGYEKADPEKQVVLFLESKFSEYYLDLCKELEVASSYLEDVYGKEIYGKLFDDVNGKYSKGKVKNSKTQFKLISKADEYLTGIKQMVSHYIGVRNLLNDNRVGKRNCNEHEEVVKIVDDNATVLLGSIIFDDLFANSEDKQTYFDAYKSNYTGIAKILNDVSATSDAGKGLESISRLTVLEEPLTYTDVFTKGKGSKFNLDEKVRKYYFREV